MLNVQPIFPFHKYKIPNKEEMDFEIVSGKEGKVRLERFQEERFFSLQNQFFEDFLSCLFFKLYLGFNREEKIKKSFREHRNGMAIRI